MHSSNSYTPPAAIPEFIIRHATLRQFQIFEAIVRLGSYTRAAEELFLTQPTVSMQTKKLSDAIGMPLFEQVGRKVKPTEAGEVLYASVRTIFDTLSNVEMAVSDLKGIKRGRIRLGVITTAKYFAPELLGLFSDQYPGVEVALKVSNRDRILDRISQNEDDLYIIGQAPADATDLVVHPFSPNPLVVMAPKNHPLVGRKNITLEELAEQPLIMREPGSGIRDATLRMFEERGLRPNVRMELGSNEAIKHAVYGGLGLAILSLHTLRLEGRSGPIELLDVENFPIMRQWFIVYPKGKELSLVAKEFLDFSISHEINIREELMRDFPEVFDDREKMAKLKAVK